MPKRNVTLLDRKEIADATWSFHLDPGPEEFSYRPGQTVDLTIPNPPYSDDAGNRRTFSLASAPGGDALLVATRVRGSAFKRSLLEIPPGARIDLEGPFGSFTLPTKPTAAVFLAGGIGVTPFRAMVEDALTRPLEHSLTLIHSSRTPEEAPFHEELQEWSRGNPRFVYRATMTQPEQSRKAWAGERRRVSPELLAELLPTERGNSLYYVAGPERFVQAAVNALAVVDVDKDHIRSEAFPGY